MSLQWIRAIKLLVQLDSDGDAIDLSDFHIRFFVKQALTTVPGSAEIRVYNVSASTGNLLASLSPTYNKDGTLANGVTPLNVVLQAGYTDNCDIIFKGQIRQIRRGRENQTDTFVDILAQCADLAHNYAVMNTSLAAGWGPADVHGAVANSFGQYGVSAGYAPALPSYKMPRGKAMYGPARKYMNNFADTHGLSWGYRNDQLVCTPIGEPTDAETVVLRVDTGVIGMPQLTSAGVNVRCLINPKLQHGNQVQLDNASIQMPLVDVAYGADSSNYFLGENAKDADGFYQIVSVQHMGDTRGQMWYTDLITVGVNATKPVTGPYINAATPNYGH